MSRKTWREYWIDANIELKSISVLEVGPGSHCGKCQNALSGMDERRTFGKRYIMTLHGALREIQIEAHIELCPDCYPRFLKALNLSDSELRLSEKYDFVLGARDEL